MIMKTEEVIRVRLDLSDHLEGPFKHQWASFHRSHHGSIVSLTEYLCKKLGLPLGGGTLHMYLNEVPYILPPSEVVDLIRDGDLLILKRSQKTIQLSNGTQGKEKPNMKIKKPQSSDSSSSSSSGDENTKNPCQTYLNEPTTNKQTSKNEKSSSKVMSKLNNKRSNSSSSSSSSDEDIKKPCRPIQNVSSTKDESKAMSKLNNKNPQSSDSSSDSSCDDDKDTNIKPSTPSVNVTRLSHQLSKNESSSGNKAAKDDDKPNQMDESSSDSSSDEEEIINLSPKRENTRKRKLSMETPVANHHSTPQSTSNNSIKKRRRRRKKRNRNALPSKHIEPKVLNGSMSQNDSLQTPLLSKNGPDITCESQLMEEEEANLSQLGLNALVNGGVVHVGRRPDSVLHSEKKKPPPKQSPEDFHSLRAPPKPGDYIAYKILELSHESYTPGISEFKRGKVISFDGENICLEKKGEELNKGRPMEGKLGKFDLEPVEYAMEEESCSTYSWKDLIDVRACE
eukprot:TRINITY_DN2389_c0_g2_i1.p1 TRINITY_DN2389_c0_g2~~TRINITY_DN2389_c0_g2_i1.p1  ORF type:complete len:509 (+),score=109.71 TRINITY_DN2389_c0_g2_i1:182-1708(+)